MAGAGASSPFIKPEPEEHIFNSNGPQQQFMGTNPPQLIMPQQHFNQFGSNSSVDPNELMGGTSMSMHNGSYTGGSFQHFGNQQSNNSGAAFSKGIAGLDDDDLLEGLPHEGHQAGSSGIQGGGQDFNGLNDFDFNMTSQNVYNQNGNSGLSIDQAHMNGYSNTPEGDPIQSPFVHNFNALQFRQMQGQQPFSSSLQSPVSYAGSPLAGSDMNDSYMTVKGRPRVAPPMQRKGESFSGQPIRSTHRHQKTLSGQWDQTPSSMTSFPGSEFGSPLQGAVHPNPQISDILKTGSLPPKLGGNSSQEMKRRRRRESHNLVERRRRDNINERIQELSHLVPVHRLEDEKVRKALQNNSPLSPTLAGLSQSPPQATSGLAGPGARRATGNITTGIPVEEKDKGPNKGDILNGAVSWMRDLMWMLHIKLQQQEDLANMITELGGTFPYQLTEDEKRMQSELMAALKRNDATSFSYSRTHGSGLRVPEYTDAKGDPINGPPLESTSLSPDGNSTGDAAGVGTGQFWNSGETSGDAISFKEEDEYSMELN